MTKEDAEPKWITWRGGECPVSGDTVVSIISRSGLDQFTDQFMAATCMARELDWSNSSEHHRCDIVQYRVIKQGAPAKEKPKALDRDEALAWLVENVKVWPTLGKPIYLSGMYPWFFWYPPTKHDTCGVAFARDGFPLISKQDWQDAKSAPASNKPSWDDAPYRAKILVQSANGRWNFGSYAKANSAGSRWRGVGRGEWLASTEGVPNPNWRDTLEHRSTVEESFTVDAGINKYNKPCKGITIDVYDVLKAFEVTCPAMQHAIKKCLMAGKRGAKGAVQDMDEAIQSIERSKALL